MVSFDTHLPSLEELTVPEIRLTTAPLIAASLYLGKCCDYESKEFMLCHYESQDPRKCVDKGKALTYCGNKFFQLVKKNCSYEFEPFYSCVNKYGGSSYDLTRCRSYQNAFDKCMQSKANLDHPPVNYFNRTRLHKTDQPRNELGSAPMPETIPDLPDFSTFEKHKSMDDRRKTFEILMD